MLYFYQSYHRQSLPIPSSSCSLPLIRGGYIPQRPKGPRLEKYLTLQHRVQPIPKARHCRRPPSPPGLCTRIPPSISLYNPSLITLFPQQITRCDKISSSATMRKANCRRGTSTSHLRPSRPSRRRMPALATHISAPNLLFAPTTSISTDLRSGSKLHRPFEALGYQIERLFWALASPCCHAATTRQQITGPVHLPYLDGTGTQHWGGMLMGLLSTLSQSLTNAQ